MDGRTALHQADLYDECFLFVYFHGGQTELPLPAGLDAGERRLGEQYIITSTETVAVLRAPALRMTTPCVPGEAVLSFRLVVKTSHLVSFPISIR